MLSQDSCPDFDPLLDLDNDAPSEFKCPITMSIMKHPVIMEDGQTYEKSAIENALKFNPISPLTRQPMDMSSAKTNHALKNLIDKYIQDHLHEIQKEPEVIDPSKIIQAIPADDQVKIAQVHEIHLEKFTGFYTKNSMHITIKPESISGRLPVSIIALVDVSGSMDDDASLSTPGTENSCFSRLQLVQYALKTVISLLGPSDHLTLITFSNHAKIMLENIAMNDSGKEKAVKIIDEMEDESMTNIWDALDKGIDQAIMHFNEGESINTSILLFTDGEPNINPKGGIIQSLKNKLSNVECHFSISAFGFGYRIDSDLLAEIAEIGNGIYGYCPDATMVGTIFINYVSSLISMVAPLAVLTIQNQSKYNIVLYNEASTNVLVTLNNIEDLEAVDVSLSLPLTNQVFKINEIKELTNDNEEEMNCFRDQVYRKCLINLIQSVRTKEADNEQSIKNVITLYEKLKSETNRTQFMKNMMIDLCNDDDKHGQIERAFNSKYFKKWGKNYVYSLLRFHLLEQCGNIKDLSLQLYGNEVFRKFRKIGNKIFMNLPIPEKRSSRCWLGDSDDLQSSVQPNATSYTRRNTMRSYCSSCIVICFNGEALVDMFDGSKKEVRKLQKGDKLSNGRKLVCLVKCGTKNGYSDAVKIGNALFSPYHPVRVHIDGNKCKSWVFPAEIGCIEKVKIESWYNMVIDGENSPVLIGGVETVTLGHNMKNDVCYHPYYGTKKVIEALKKYDQFDEGFIEFKDPPVAKRDPTTNMVVECF